MKGFIEVEQIYNGKTLVAVKYICCVEQEGNITFVYINNLAPIKTTETYEEIKQKIKEAQGEK